MEARAWVNLLPTIRLGGTGFARCARRASHRAIEHLTAPAQGRAREARSWRWDVIVASAAWIGTAGGPTFWGVITGRGR